MKHVIIVVVLLFATCGGRGDVDKLLADVWDKDQDVRHKMMELTKAVVVDGCVEKVDLLLMISELQNRIDVENMAIMERILQNGLPKNLSPDSYKTIWLVIDHAPLEKQVQYIPIIEQMVKMGAMGADEYAILSDRVAMGQNRPQLYGSQIVQFGTPDAMQMYVYPIEKPDILDSLRASVGLSPMVEYLDQVAKSAGLEVKYMPTMTIEQLEKLRNE